MGNGCTDRVVFCHMSRDSDGDYGLNYQPRGLSRPGLPTDVNFLLTSPDAGLVPYFLIHGTMLLKHNGRKEDKFISSQIRYNQIIVGASLKTKTNVPHIN